MITLFIKRIYRAWYAGNFMFWHVFKKRFAMVLTGEPSSGDSITYKNLIAIWMPNDWEPKKLDEDFIAKEIVARRAVGGAKKNKKSNAPRKAPKAQRR